MLQYKCKKSVFCILFLVCFFLGTICGIILFRCLQGARGVWIIAYGAAFAELEQLNVPKQLFFACKPLLLALLLGICPKGYRLVPFLIGARGCMTAYLMAFYFASDLSPAIFVLRWLFLFPVFYYLCRWAYFADDASGRRLFHCASTA